MKAKTKRRLKHLVTKKKLVKKRHSHHVLRGFYITVLTICTGSLAFAVATSKPVIDIGVHTTAFGQTISAPTPTPKKPGSPDQVGRGSWYALGLAHPDALSCASRTFPRGTYLEVTNMNNGHKVTCLVDDYGPEAWTGRVIDLSRGSFSQVSNLGVGTIPVQIRVVNQPSGFVIPVPSNLGELFGYSLCDSKYTAVFCDSNRQNATLKIH